MGSVLSLPQAGVAVEWLSVDDSLVSRARNTLVAKFLESRAEPLLFVDAGIGFDPLQIVAMLNFGQEFVAGVAPVKDYFPDGLRYAATTCTTKVAIDTVHMAAHGRGSGVPMSCTSASCTPRSSTGATLTADPGEPRPSRPRLRDDQELRRTPTNSR